ncbi:MAG: selenocysteine-specific translation elongation factor [Anaerolineales bacterium]|uniref:selenocysteine-specific translation elongation factor n=1 Tax=Candidatus Villigracilis vicinus TaxID=3140679 RepID=UPI003134A571|nr:selenocysteine-specific translation elongation factor [Anaerolineales bacterium]
MRVIGTAGHVDHGKSTLIEALTGTHPDRLKEEKAREMTIELGFGWLTLPNGEELGIVDVPGHRDFIENMLSGVGGIDAAMLVIAADEGIMPQTKEHLAILDLLQIPAGLIVLTKTDLASDSDWLDLIEADIRTAVNSTILKDAPILRVSAKTNKGLTELTLALENLLKDKPSRPDLNRPRLPIDRVFTISGFGTVVTGTLRDGSFSVGDDIEVLPNSIQGRIRGLQTHKKKEESTTPGSRTAVNISGVDMEQIRRGDVLVHPGQYQATRRIDARFKSLKDILKPLAHGDEVKFFVGASETVATLRLLGTEELKAGEEGWIQLELRDPIVTLRGDRYILRRPSPGETLGGGAVVDHQPKGRHKRFDANVIKSLESLAQGSPAEILFEAALALQIAPVKEMFAKSRLEAAIAETAWQELLQNGQVLVLDDSTLAVALPYWNTIESLALKRVEEYHGQFPLRRGIPREELKSKLKLAPKVFNAVLTYLISHNTVLEIRGAVSKPEHEVHFDGQDALKVQVLRRKFEANPFNTPSVKECQAEAGEEVVSALIELGELLPVSQEVIFRKTDYDEMVRQIVIAIQQNGQITLGEVRDMFNTSRKYVQALLEYLDATGTTMRDGDARKLRK